MISLTFDDFMTSLGYANLGSWQMPWMGLILLIIISAVLLLVYKLINKYVVGRMVAKGASPNFFNAFRFLFRFALIIVILVLATNLLNLNSEYVVIISGILVTAIAFASMKSITNFIAGIYLVVTNPFNVGDYVKIGSEEGIVTEISLNHTRIKHRDASRSCIPNTNCLGAKIHNYTISIEWFRNHISLLEQMIENNYQKLSKKSSLNLEMQTNRLEDELKELRRILREIEAIQAAFIEQEEEEDRIREEAREQRRKDRAEKIADLMKRRAESVFADKEDRSDTKKETAGVSITEKEAAGRDYNWPTHSIYVDRDKIVRYTFKLRLPKEPKRNARLLDQLCETWTDEFQVTPRWRITGLDSRIEYEFIFLTPDPYDIIHFYDEFIEDVYQILYDRKE